MRTLSMKLAISEYERAVATIEWFKKFDTTEKSEQVKLDAKIIATSTTGAKEVMETLQLCAPALATELRGLAISWSQEVIDAFPAKMAELLAKQ